MDNMERQQEKQRKLALKQEFDLKKKLEFEQKIKLQKELELKNIENLKIQQQEQECKEDQFQKFSLKQQEIVTKQQDYQEFQDSNKRLQIKQQKEIEIQQQQNNETLSQQQLLELELEKKQESFKRLVQQNSELKKLNLSIENRNNQQSEIPSEKVSQQNIPVKNENGRVRLSQREFEFIKSNYSLKNLQSVQQIQQELNLIDKKLKDESQEFLKLEQNIESQLTMCSYQDVEENFEQIKKIQSQYVNDEYNMNSLLQKKYFEHDKITEDNMTENSSRRMSAQIQQHEQKQLFEKIIEDQPEIFEIFQQYRNRNSLQENNGFQSLKNLKRASVPDSKIQIDVNASKQEIPTENQQRYEGYLKFFDDQKNYGFLTNSCDKKDIFVHYDDLFMAKVSKEMLKSQNQLNLYFQYDRLQYVGGKYEVSYKAINLKMLKKCERDQIHNQS